MCVALRPGDLSEPSFQCLSARFIHSRMNVVVSALCRWGMRHFSVKTTKKFGTRRSPSSVRRVTY